MAEKSEIAHWLLHFRVKVFFLQYVIELNINDIPDVFYHRMEPNCFKMISIYLIWRSYIDNNLFKALSQFKHKYLVVLTIGVISMCLHIHGNLHRTEVDNELAILGLVNEFIAQEIIQVLIPVVELFCGGVHVNNLASPVRIESFLKPWCILNSKEDLAIHNLSFLSIIGWLKSDWDVHESP